jgi:hypothetical protein
VRQSPASKNVNTVAEGITRTSRENWIASDGVSEEHTQSQSQSQSQSVSYTKS